MDYVEATFYVDGQRCIDTGVTPGNWQTYTGSEITTSNPSTVQIWLGTDTADGDVVSAFDSVFLVQTELALYPVLRRS